MGRNAKALHLPRESLEAIRTATHSCVAVTKCSYHITLHPFHTRDINHSVKEILNNGISQYHKEFGAIVLGYENVVICGSYAPMCDDAPYIHTHIEADFYLFKPTVGETLEGIVNKKNDHHLSVLVHKLFNVSLPKPADVDEWSGHNAKIGQRIQLKVTYTQLDARLPYIRGELIDEDIDIISSKSPKKKKKKSKKTTEAAEDSELNDMITELKAHKKKKKGKRMKTPSLLDDTLSDLNLQEIFAESDSKVPVSITNSNVDIIDDIILPSDSEMEEILKDVQLPKSKKKRKNSEKDCETTVKKKRRSKSDITSL